MSRLENTIIQHPPARRSMSTTRVINLVDDDSNSPPAIRRRITEPAHDEDIIILDDDHGRRVVNGTANRPIVISDNSVDGGTWNRRLPRIPPPVIANAQPFAILAPPQGSEDTYRRRVPFDEPPQPSTSSTSSSTAPPRGSGIQLGGGLVSQGLRPRRGGQAARNNDASAGGVDGPSRAGRIVATFLNDPGPPLSTPHIEGARQRIQFSDILGVFSLEQMGRRATRFFGIDPLFDYEHPEHAFQRRDEAIGIGPDYTKEMTHPGAPPPGWSFNFGIEDDNDMEAKPTAPSEVLVCAMCLDPLYANIDGRNDLSAEEKKRRRIWALRCGHMFDGKCMETFMAPTWTRERPSAIKEDEKPVKAEEGLLADESTSASDQDKGKGKETMKDEVPELSLDVVDETTAPQVSIPNTPVPTSHPEPEVQLLDSVPSDTTPSQTSTAGPTSTSTSTTAPGARYNLRTRRTRQEEASTGSNSPSRSTRRGRAAAAQGTETSTSQRRPPRGTKRKFGEKVVSEVELRKNEARYNWSCRVAGCGKMHSSYNWQGEWKPDEENGPIAVYI